MRLLTRSDFDGLACAVLLKDLGVMEDWKFVHPKDVQDGKIDVGPNDILANVPYAKGAGMWFDHHSSEEERLQFDFEYKGASRSAPSCARVVWEYYGGRDRFGDKYDEMLRWVDKVDSGDLSAEEIENPQGWVLLGFIMDPRTGLGRFRDYRISNYQLMEELIGFCRELPIEEILALPDVQERVARYNEQQELYKAMVRDNARMEGNVLVLDLRNQEPIYTGNRFLMYTLYPDCNVSIQIIWGLNKQNTVFTVGHSVTNRTCTADVGSLMLRHGGGGHRQVGTCQVPNDKAKPVLAELLDALRDS
jgi:nanoRNase/pAp phosphatase (c-di-AMP/oligoRNAs hydrolase)